MAVLPAVEAFRLLHLRRVSVLRVLLLVVVFAFVSLSPKIYLCPCPLSRRGSTSIRLLVEAVPWALLALAMSKAS